MYDREMAQDALQMMTPTHRAMVEETARTRGIPACDVVLETALLVAQEESKEVLYALKQRQVRPKLRALV